MKKPNNVVQTHTTQEVSPEKCVSLIDFFVNELRKEIEKSKNTIVTVDSDNNSSQLLISTKKFNCSLIIQ